MKPITTPLTRMLKVQVPVVSAPMANVTNATLATHVTLGGGFGFIAAGYTGANAIRKELNTVRSILDSRGQSHSFHLPIGVGYLGWKLDEAGADGFGMLDAALDYNVRAIWLAYGDDLGKYVAYVRKHDEKCGRHTVVFINVNSVSEALRAVKEWKPDVIVAQGIEAGGHAKADTPPVFALVSSILNSLPGPREGAVPVVAAGGITGGAQVAAFLALGAAGVAMGTRFLLTPEALLSDPQKAALLAAGPLATVRTEAFDQIRNTPWPEGIDGRGLKNQIVEDIQSGADIATVQRKFAEGAKSGQAESAIVFAGTGVGDLHEVQSAQEIMKNIHGEIVQQLRVTQWMLGSLMYDTM